MRNRHYSSLVFAAATLILLAVSSCTKEPWPNLFRDGSRTIIPVVSKSSMVEGKTKAGVSGPDSTCIAVYPIVTSEGDSLFISVYESDNWDMPEDLSAQMPQTKGQVVTADVIKGDSFGFTMNGWLESLNRYNPSDPSQTGDSYISTDHTDHNFLKNASVKHDGSQWILTCSSGNDNGKYWRNKVATNFWSVYPSDLPSITTNYAYPVPDTNNSVDDANQKKLSFGYTVQNTASAQRDLCFAYNRQTWDEDQTGNTNKVNIDFNHALSAVYLDITDLASSFTSVDVTFKNIYKTGACAVAGSGTNSVEFDWASTAPSNKGNVSQTFDVSSSSADFAVVEGRRIQKFQGNGSSAKVFMMIPQSLPDEAVLAISNVRRSDNSTLTGTIPDVPIALLSDGITNVKWNPGKKYLYKISKGDPEEYNWNFVFASNATYNTPDNKATWRPFDNTTNDSDVTVINVTSKKTKKGSSSPENADWVISKVQIGSGDPESVSGDGTSYANTDGAVGVTVTKTATGLSVTALARTSSSRGSKQYWHNTMGRTDSLDWSPDDWSSKGVIDLSKTDFAADDASKINTENMTTANCYIIRHAGTYMLPLVYGNAIKNGSTNLQSYKPTMADGGNSTYFLSNFINSKNSNIVSPFIENNSALEVDGGIILWQDEANLIHKVTITDGSGAPNPKKPFVSNVSNVRYLQFTISPEEICQNNALIAATDRNGNILWSWHIWITNDPDLLEPAIPVKNHAGNIYNFFPLSCLGYIDPTNYLGREDIIITLRQKVSNNTIALTVKQPIVLGDANGCYYQFGRKDPMCRVDNPVQNGGTGTFNKNGYGKVSLADAIQHPEVFYNYGSGNFDWCQSEYYNLWSGGYCGKGLIENTKDGLSKTVYDPSPRGYMMPASNAFTNFTTTGSNAQDSSQFNVVGDFDKGWNFKTNIGSTTIFFPAAGLRGSGDGECSNVGKNGGYWSAVPYDTYYGHNLYFYSEHVYPVNYSSRSFGYSARPVKE